MQSKGLFSIGELAVTCGISVNTLRFYQSKELLIPAYTDTDSGYRYYSYPNLLRLQEILDLRDAGLSLGEIKGYLDANTGAGQRLAELLTRRELLDRAIEAVRIRTVVPGDITVGKLTLPKRLCLCRTFLSRDADHLFRELSGFYAEVIRQGVTISRAWPEFCEYPDNSLLMGVFSMTDFPVTACLPVDAQNAPPEAVLYPGGEALVVNFKGGYDGLPQVYAALSRYIEENDCLPAGYPQEIYLEIGPDGSVHPGCEDYITRIIVPIKSKNPAGIPEI